MGLPTAHPPDAPLVDMTRRATGSHSLPGSTSWLVIPGTIKHAQRITVRVLRLAQNEHEGSDPP